MPVFGGIEAGGTKVVCAVGTGPEDVDSVSLPTTTPDDTVARVVAFFRPHRNRPLSAIGIASFGPLDLDHGSSTYGRITTTPKEAWRDYDILSAISRALAVPTGLDTDVNAAARAEARWGAAADVSDCLYLTVGTGIGGGAVIGGRVLRGLSHPEMGHIRVPHDVQQDPFPGVCPYHGDCLEGLASGPAVAGRWGKPAEQLPPDHPAWSLEAHYLALALSTFIYTLSPQRIILGGGLMRQTGLLPLIRKNVADLLNGYVATRPRSDELERVIVPPLLGERAGVLGAILLAEEAWRSGRAPQ